MADKNIGAIIVKDQDKLTGIFSERDYARKVVLKGKNSTDTKLAEVMSKEDNNMKTRKHFRAIASEIAKSWHAAC